MAIIDFEAISADLSIGIGETEGSYLSFRVRLSGNESVTLSTGESFDDLNGRVTVKPDRGEQREQEKQVGSVHYLEAFDDDIHPQPASYIVQATLPPNRFIELLSAAQFGRVPSEISVSIEGMEYDWQPDGSGKKWDNKNSPYLPVSSVNFLVPLLPFKQGEQTEMSHAEQLLPATRQQAEKIIESLDRRIAGVDEKLKQIIWAIVVLGGLLVYLKL